ncbi:MAG: hypothetical protein GC156_15735 [Actinomycetales bacterium]|nr:hypothetical protein [Actinomycetales bacterium]
MNKTLLAALNSTERLLIDETEPASLALLDEDETAALHARVLRARNKAQGVYRRGASGKVSAKGGRGKAFGENSHARLKVEAFEEALGRVSARLATLARQSARELKEARLAAAAEAKAGGGAQTRAGRSRSAAPAAKGTAKRPLRTPASQKKRAGNQSANARWQGKRDAR